VLPTAFADDDGTLSNPQDYPPIPEMPNGATMETEAKEYCEHLMRAYHRKWAKSVEEARELDRKNGTAKWG